MKKKNNLLKPLAAFQKEGFWLAVVTRRQEFHIAAVAKDPRQAFEKAQSQGFNDAFLMRSSKDYTHRIPCT